MSKIHVCTRTIAKNNRHKTNNPVIIVMGDDQDFDDGRRARAVIIKDKRGVEVARIVQVGVNGRLSTGSNCWVQTNYDVEIVGKTVQTEPIEPIPEWKDAWTKELEAKKSK